MSQPLLAVLSAVGMALFLGLPLLTLAYAVVLWRLNKRQPVPRPLLRRSALMLGLWLAALVAFLSASTFRPAPRGYPVAWLGDALLACGTLTGAALLALRPRPIVLARLGWPLTVGGPLLTALMAFSIHVAALAYEVTSHSNPDIGAVRAALTRDPNDSAAHLSLGYDLMMHSDPKAAAGEFQRAAQLEPAGSPYRDEASFMLGHMLMREGRRAQALAVYRRLATQDDGWGKAAKRYVAQLGG